MSHSLSLFSLLVVSVLSFQNLHAQSSRSLSASTAIQMQQGTIKCGFPVLQEYHRNQNNLSTEARTLARSMLQSTVQAAYTHRSPSGKFQIYYDTTGRHAVPTDDTNQNGVPDYVDQVAAAADSSWRHQVQTLGYADPVTGPANPYPIYLENTSAYGYTDFGDNRELASPTYIVIHNNFEGFPINTDPEGHQTGSIKVTVAHELKHAIQYANSEWYGWPSNAQSPHSTNWSEMDATLMEEVVYDNVNDYYNYIQGPQRSSVFISSSHQIPVAYDGVTWFIFFQEHYGPQFWPTVWQRIKTRYEQQKGAEKPDYLGMKQAIQRSLEEDYDDSFEHAFVLSHLWHYASGPTYSRNSFGFEESQHYPDPLRNVKLTARDSMDTDENISSLGAKYISAGKSMDLEGYVQVQADLDQPSSQLGLLFFKNDGSVETLIRSGTWSEHLDIKSLVRWEDIEEVGIVAANPETGTTIKYRLTVTSHAPKQVQLAQNYPNPFNPGTTIEFGLPRQTHVQLAVYNVAGRKVATLRDEVLPAGFHTVPFNGSNLASGIYFYRLITDQQVIVKKMTLIK